MVSVNGASSSSSSSVLTYSGKTVSGVPAHGEGRQTYWDGTKAHERAFKKKAMRHGQGKLCDEKKRLVGQKEFIRGEEHGKCQKIKIKIFFAKSGRYKRMCKGKVGAMVKASTIIPTAGGTRVRL